MIAIATVFRTDKHVDPDPQEPPRRLGRRPQWSSPAGGIGWYFVSGPPSSTMHMEAAPASSSSSSGRRLHRWSEQPPSELSARLLDRGAGNGSHPCGAPRGRVPRPGLATSDPLVGAARALAPHRVLDDADGRTLGTRGPDRSRACNPQALGSVQPGRPGGDTHRGDRTTALNELPRPWPEGVLAPLIAALLAAIGNGVRPRIRPTNMSTFTLD